ncbi:hypothetical protein MMC09_000384 [Bachmanniomyces sp. S44760]|nr:hypothetical protein [Bachmanniomyces sp. S44760]
MASHVRTLADSLPLKSVKLLTRGRRGQRAKEEETSGIPPSPPKALPTTQRRTRVPVSKKKEHVEEPVKANKRTTSEKQPSTSSKAKRPITPLFKGGAIVHVWPDASVTDVASANGPHRKLQYRMMIPAESLKLIESVLKFPQKHEALRAVLSLPDSQVTGFRQVSKTCDASTQTVPENIDLTHDSTDSTSTISTSNKRKRDEAVTEDTTKSSPTKKPRSSPQSEVGKVEELAEKVPSEEHSPDEPRNKQWDEISMVEAGIVTADGTPINTRNDEITNTIKKYRSKILRKQQLKRRSAEAAKAAEFASQQQVRALIEAALTAQGSSATNNTTVTSVIREQASAPTQVSTEAGDAQQPPETPRSRSWFGGFLPESVSKLVPKFPFTGRSTPHTQQIPSVNHAGSVVDTPASRPIQVQTPGTSIPQAQIPEASPMGIDNSTFTVQTPVTPERSVIENSVGAKRHEQPTNVTTTEHQAWMQDEIKRQVNLALEARAKEDAALEAAKSGDKRKRASKHSADDPDFVRKYGHQDINVSQMNRIFTVPSPSDNSESDASGDETSPTRAVKRVRFTDEVVGNPYRAKPYTGSHFTLPPSRQHDERIFYADDDPFADITPEAPLNTNAVAPNTGSAPTTVAPNTGSAHSAATKSLVNYVSPPINYCGRGRYLAEGATNPGFTVPYDSDSDSDEGDEQASAGQMTVDQPIPGLSAPSQDNSVRSQSNSGTPLEATKGELANSWSQPPPPRPNPTHAALPAESTDVDTAALARARSMALKYAPKTASGLRESSRLSSSSAGSEVGRDDTLLEEGSEEQQSSQKQQQPFASETSSSIRSALQPISNTKTITRDQEKGKAKSVLSGNDFSSGWENQIQISNSTAGTSLLTAVASIPENELIDFGFQTTATSVPEGELIDIGFPTTQTYPSQVLDGISPEIQQMLNDKWSEEDSAMSDRVFADSFNVWKRQNNTLNTIT